jgi:hypothetical protein
MNHVDMCNYSILTFNPSKQEDPEPVILETM